MQENWLALATSFKSEQRYVLATIVKTAGATYRKAGTMMLVSENGDCTGLLSGGCLEADIALHSQQVLASGESRLVHYDLTSDADLLWGLGLGCEGEISIWLQALTPENDYLMFQQVLADATQGRKGLYAIKIDQKIAENCYFSVEKPMSNDFDITQEVFFKKHIGSDYLIVPTQPVLNVLICGAGPDAAPVVAMAQSLGWQVNLWDHRKQSLAQPQFSSVNKRREIRAEHSQLQDFSGIDAAIVMTHNLAFDQEYLANLITADINYIGLLGPLNRRNKLLKNLGYSQEEFNGQVFGPIGLNIGGRSPQAIALSICAQIQQHFMAMQPMKLPKYIKATAENIAVVDN